MKILSDRIVRQHGMEVRTLKRDGAMVYREGDRYCIDIMGPGEVLKYRINLSSDHALYLAELVMDDIEKGDFPGSTSAEGGDHGSPSL